jgi:hypothetical protein
MANRFAFLPLALLAAVALAPASARAEEGKQCLPTTVNQSAPVINNYYCCNCRPKAHMRKHVQRKPRPRPQRHIVRAAPAPMVPAPAPVRGAEGYPYPPFPQTDCIRGPFRCPN